MGKDQEAQAEVDTLDEADLLDGKRQPAGDHSGHGGGDEASASFGGPDERQRCDGDEQIVEDRRLATLSAERDEGCEIDDPGEQRPLAIGDAAGEASDDPRGGNREQPRDQLILLDPATAQSGDGGVDQEQADRLSVPDIDIGQLAMVDRLADQQIILVVDVEQRIAEYCGARDDRNCEQGKDRPQAEPPRVERSRRTGHRHPHRGDDKCNLN